LPEKQYGRVAVGDPVAVTSETVPGQQFAGRVRAIAQEAEYTPRTVETKEERASMMYAIRVEIENARGALRVGAPVDVRFR
jgi:hypothetical protein